MKISSNSCAVISTQVYQNEVLDTKNDKLSKLHSNCAITF